MARYIRLLRENPDFTRLWLAQVVSLTGDWFNTVVLLVLVAEFSDGSGLAISFYLALRVLAPLLVSPLAGVLVDRFDRRMLLIMSNLLRAFVVPLFLLVNSPDLLWLIYVVTTVQFVLSAIFEPGQSAILPTLVRPHELVEANTLLSITWSVMLALGAVLGGVFASIFGTAAALLADAATFLVAAGFIAMIKTRQQQAPQREDGSRPDTGFRDGLRFVWRTPPVAASLFIKFGISLGNVDTLMTVFATQLFVLGANGELSLGILYSTFGLGAVAGPLLANRVNDGSLRRMRRLVTVGFIVIVAGWVVLGGATGLLLAALAMLLRAIGGSINWTYSTIMLQKTAPGLYLGRVFSLDYAGFQIATVLSTMVHGALIEAAGPQNAPLIALGTGLFSLLPLAVWARIARHINRSEISRTEPAPAVIPTGGAL